MILFSSCPSWNSTATTRPRFYSVPSLPGISSWNITANLSGISTCNMKVTPSGISSWNMKVSLPGIFPGIWIRPLPGISSWNILIVHTQIYRQTNNLSTYPFLFLELNSNLKQAERRDGSKVGMLLPSLLSAWIKSWPGGSQYKIS